MNEIKISRDFAPSPGGRYKKNGPLSGEQFREDLLVPKFIDAIEKSETLCINLDDGYGYINSFLEESFGGLAREYGSEKVLGVLCFISNDQPSLIQKIESYITEAK